MQQNYPWFEAAYSAFTNAVKQGMPPHALLIGAPKGSGKKDYALYIAMSLLCSNNNNLKGGCGECKSCHLFESQTHPDFYLVDCLVDKKGVQKKTIGIDQIRLLNEKLQDTAQLQGWRIAVVRSVNAMTTASFNSLLKTLEEPGEKTLLVLLSDNLQSVPATVRSRCQLMPAELKEKTLLTWLATQVTLPKENLREALKINQFAPIATLDFLQQDGFELQQELTLQLDAVLSNQLTPGEFFSQCRWPVESLADKVADYLYQVQWKKMCGKDDGLYYKLPEKLVFQLYQKIVDFKRAQQSGSNLQIKLQIEAILIQWFEFGRKISHYSKA